MTDIQVQMLGDTVIRADGRAHRITSPKLRAVLALLLSAPGQVCTVETLAQELWKQPPPRAITTVQTYLYQLRRQFDAIRPGASAAVMTQASRYETAFDAATSDIIAFQTRAAEGFAALAEQRLPEAVRLLRGALDLWRGEPFADVPMGHGLDAVAARLRELRRLVELSLVDARLLSGCYEEALPTLRTLVAAQPLAEGCTSRLLAALVALGRYADARAAYDRLAGRLADELGLAPVPQLQRVRARLDGPEHLVVDWEAVRIDERADGHDGAIVARRLGCSGIALPGRAAEIRAVAGWLAGPAAGGPRVVGLYGPAGVGKTAVALAAARQVGGRFADGPLLVDLARRDGTARSAAEVQGEILAQAGESVAGLSDADLLARYRTWSAECRMLLVLDNARSTDQVARLVPSSPRSAVLACSDVRLGGLPGARHHILDVLDEQDAATVLRQRMGSRWSSDRAAVRAVVRRCGGLPLAVHAAAQVARARALDAAGLDELLADPRRWDLLARSAPRLRESTERSWRWLDGDGRRAWLTFGRMVGPFGVHDAATALGVTELKARSMINRLRELAVLREFPGAGGHRFSLHENARLIGLDRRVSRLAAAPPAV
jgi:DNA-binding SARP family transcriptional activator